MRTRAHAPSAQRPPRAQRRTRAQCPRAHDPSTLVPARLSPCENPCGRVTTPQAPKYPREHPSDRMPTPRSPVPAQTTPRESSCVLVPTPRTPKSTRAQRRARAQVSACPHTERRCACAPTPGTPKCPRTHRQAKALSCAQVSARPTPCESPCLVRVPTPRAPKFPLKEAGPRGHILEATSLTASRACACAEKSPSSPPPEAPLFCPSRACSRRPPTCGTSRHRAASAPSGSPVAAEPGPGAAFERAAAGGAAWHPGGPQLPAPVLMYVPLQLTKFHIHVWFWLVVYLQLNIRSKEPDS
jgi:hypothetical protein